ncbi:hypothetical protein BWZ43_25800 [Heyndrickxia oleronia]|uniref:Uncharacterized protein n=1 Tax=Heyndrickxia oleronia TaxID=38875 RepID=A0A8E2I2F3_9BACI|nr:MULTISPECIES: hypothetical protein [Heyndrickxia]OOP61086.1 hypothetical protein BWZ43_25800 [Heyndrickxia oleronia]PTY93013.1 hypothetical protein B5V90_02720 [Heyndrickxia sporothermodurans]
MELVKQYNKDNTISVSLIDSNGKEVQAIENVSLEGSRGLLVVTIDEGSTLEEADMVRRALQSALETKDLISGLIVPSNVKIDYIKF